MSGTNLATIREPKIRAKYGQAESFHVSVNHTHTHRTICLSTAHTLHMDEVSNILRYSPHTAACVQTAAEGGSLSLSSPLSAATASDV